MERKPFIEAFQDINSRMIELVGSLSALRELSGFEVATIEEQELLRGSLRILVENLNLDYVMLHLRDADAALAIAAAIGWEQQDERRKQQLAWLEERAGECLLSEAQAGKFQAIYNETSCSFLVLPVKVNGEVIGVFSACHPHNGFFRVEHERSLIIYCNFLGQLIINNRLLRRMEQQVQERTRQLEKALDEAQTLKVRYQALSVIDELTGLHNRRFFFPEARAAVASACRYHKQFSIVMLDVDHFKSINDRFGHSMGDEVLKQVASMLQEQAREADIIARFGGEEFALALPETDEDGAMIVAERICRIAERMDFVIGDSHFNMTISAGVASLKSQNQQTDSRKVLDELLQQSDSALYYSKANGRNQVNRYSNLACRFG